MHQLKVDVFQNNTAHDPVAPDVQSDGLELDQVKFETKDNDYTGDIVADGAQSITFRDQDIINSVYTGAAVEAPLWGVLARWNTYAISALGAATVENWRLVLAFRRDPNWIRAVRGIRIRWNTLILATVGTLALEYLGHGLLGASHVSRDKRETSSSRSQDEDFVIV